MKKGILFTALITISLLFTGCKKNNDIVLKYEMTSKLNYAVNFYFYDTSGGLLDVDYTYSKDKENKLFIPNQTTKILLYIKHGLNAEGVIDYELNHKLDKYKDQGRIEFDKTKEELNFILKF